MAILSLALVFEDDGVLSAVLTDSRSLMRLGRRAGGIRTRDQLLARYRELRRPPQGRVISDDLLQALGLALHHELLPPGLQSALRTCAAGPLQLQLGPGLELLPWELAHDGELFLGDKFHLSRRLLQEAQATVALPVPGDKLQVLLVHDADAARRAEVLMQSLQGLPQLRVQRLTPAEMLECDRGPFQVVHWLAQAQEPPARPAAGLWLCERIEPPWTLCRAGQNVLVHQPAEGRPNFLLRLYSELTRGSTLAGALAEARLRSAEPRALLLDTVLYGDGQARLMNAAMPDADHQRQLTILCYDLVGSTRLLGDMGPERYSELLDGFHERCARICASFGGVSDDPQGDDGVMAYFGLPFASEDAAEQALRAGLVIAEAVMELGLMVRVGVSSGQVVIRAGQPVGVAVHLAARLQSIAKPGSVLTNEATRRLVRRGFEFQVLEFTPALKGIDQPGAIYSAHSAIKPGQDRLMPEAGLSPFVGRTAELEQMQRVWKRSATGLQRLCVEGEAGIGKSRLVREFRRRLLAGGHSAFECRCAAGLSGSPFRVLIEFLQRHLQLHSQDPPALSRARLAASTPARAGAADAVELLAGLLEVPGTSSALTSRAPTPEALRQRTMALLTDWLRLEACKGPLCLLIEDVHWLDPSTAEFIEHLELVAPELPLLLLTTRRTETSPSSPGSDSRIVLQGLPPDQAQDLLMCTCPGHMLPVALARRLAERADGVPLFLEESARMAQDLAAAGQSLDAADLAVPATLQDLLMTRLDRLGPPKAVAQLAAVLGREFSLPLVEALADEPTLPLRLASLEAGLEALQVAGLLRRVDRGPEIRYVFKHALVRDAAYQSLWARDRRRIHTLAARVIAERFPHWREGQPELLAHHYSEAGMTLEALHFWEIAARLASSRSAHREALAHVNRGLDMLAREPDGIERDRQELRLQLLLAGRLIATEGYGADRVAQVYERALALCQLLDDPAAQLKALLGLEGFHFMRADFPKAQSIAEQALPLTDALANPMQALQLRWACANILFHRGALAAAVASMDGCLADYGHLGHQPNSLQDPGVMCYCYSAWGLWELGYPDQALRRSLQVIELAHTLGHRFSMGEAYGFATTVHFFRGEYEQAMACAEQAIVICEDGSFVVWLAHARLMRGRLQLELNRQEQGLEEMRQAYALWTSTGAVVTRSFYLAMQAEGLARLDRPAQGLVLLEEALALVAAHGERYYEPELLRLHAELRWQAGATPASVEAGLGRALACAHELGLRSLALRAALSLARLGTAAALSIVKTEHDAITEGHQTADLREARRLLAQAGLDTRDSAREQ